MLLEGLVVALVGWEKRDEILDPALAQRRGKVIHGLLVHVGAEDDGDDGDRDICASIVVSVGARMRFRIEKTMHAPFFTR